MWHLPICRGRERMKGEDGKKLHSTQKPAELLRRVILTSTNEGDLVLDPVAGTGTTGYVAQALRRDFVMIEINPQYVKGIEQRFQRGLDSGMQSSLEAGPGNKATNFEEFKSTANFGV